MFKHYNSSNFFGSFPGVGVKRQLLDLKEGMGPKTDKHLPQSPFPGKFFWMTTFLFGVYIVIQSVVCLFLLFLFFMYKQVPHA
jgi:hypothetical protein